MTRRFNFGSEEVEYCRTSRATPLSASRSGEVARYHPIGSRIPEQDASVDSESGDKDKQRRRIAVAVGADRHEEILSTQD